LDPPFENLVKIKDKFFERGFLKVGNGKETQFLGRHKVREHTSFSTISIFI
jgi:hypothetical protein